MEHLREIITFILGGGFIAFAGWVISLRTQLRKLRNDAINSNSDTTDRSLEVSMKLIKSNEVLQEKVGIMMQQATTLSEELREVKSSLVKSNEQLLQFAAECTCGAAKKLHLN